MTRIDYFFSMASPWAYIGHGAFMDLAQRHGAAVTFRPIPLRRLFPETGGLPLPKRHPVRQKYRLLELQRWRARRGVPLRLQPQYWPFEPALLDQLIALIAADHRDPDPLMRRAFAAIWDQERDLADPGVISELARASGFEPSLIDRASGEAAQDIYEANLRRALEAGVFGAPSYGLNGEIFWGQDRLDLLDEALASGRAPYAPAP